MNMRSLPHTVSVLAALLLIAPVDLPAATPGETLRQANAMEASGDLRGALRLYRKVLKRVPYRADVLLRIESILVRTGRRVEAGRLLESHLKERPQDRSVRLRLADIQSETGDLKGAIAHWERIVADASDEGTFALVARRFLKHNLPSRALSVCRQGRKTLDNPLLFAREMAEIAERHARYPDAVAEYLVFVRQQPHAVGSIEARFRRYAREGDRHDRILAALGREIRAHPRDDISLRLFTEYAIAAGREASALRVIAASSRLHPVQETFLLRLANHAFHAGRFETAAAGYRMLLAGSETAAGPPGVLLGLGRANEGLARVDTAAALYRGLIGGYPGTRYAQEAGYRLGRLLRRDYGDATAALDAFRAVAGSKRRTSWRYRALFEIADIMVIADRLDEAEMVYARVAREQQGTEDAVQARFSIAECRYLSGDIVAARAMIDTLLSGASSRFAYNDALALSVLLEHADREDAGVLRTYAAASRLVRRQMPEAALIAFRRFVESHPKSGLLDRALATQITLLERLGRYGEAIRMSRRLLASVPWSPLCPQAMLTAGRIYDRKLGQYQDALQAYESVLAAYPHSLEAGEARERVRALREKIKTLETNREEPG